MLKRYEQFLEDDYNILTCFSSTETLCVTAKGRRDHGTKIKMICEHSDESIEYMIAKIVFGNVQDEKQMREESASRDMVIHNCRGKHVPPGYGWIPSSRIRLCSIEKFNSIL